MQIAPLTRPEGRSAIFDFLLAHHALGNMDLPAPDRLELEFLGFCVEGFSQSPAQLFQDLYVLFKLRRKSGGYFVEFGATDGITLSNTFLLERHHQWQGILAEPNPVWHAELENNRSARIDHRCVWISTGGILRFVASQMPEFAGLSARARVDHHAAARLAGSTEIDVETVSLTDLLTGHHAPAVIDYLSVDTEGSELDILAGFDFSRYRIRLITVEHNYVDTTRVAIHRLLASHGYVREFEIFSRWDDWYYHPQLV